MGFCSPRETITTHLCTPFLILKVCESISFSDISSLAMHPSICRRYPNTLLDRSASAKYNLASCGVMALPEPELSSIIDFILLALFCSKSGRSCVPSFENISLEPGSESLDSSLHRTFTFFSVFLEFEEPDPIDSFIFIFVIIIIIL